MKIWLSKNSEIPVREQLATQIVLAIASGDLIIGERLPSTREIARRFNVHFNTVSSAYKHLAAQGWLEFRQGSGFYVSGTKPEMPENSLDLMIAEFFQNVRQRGFSFAEVKKRLLRFFEVQPPEKFLVVESDADLRKILIEEIKLGTGFSVDGMSFEDFRLNHHATNCIVVAMFDEKAKIKSLPSAGKTLIFLKARSAAEAMKDKPRPSRENLIAVISGWEKFLTMAKTMLLAANVDAECLLIRSTNQTNWRKGLDSAAMIICDSVCAQHFQNDKRTLPFKLISDESLSELRTVIKNA